MIFFFEKQVEDFSNDAPGNFETPKSELEVPKISELFFRCKHESTLSKSRGTILSCHGLMDLLFNTLHDISVMEQYCLVMDFFLTHYKHR